MRFSAQFNPRRLARLAITLMVTPMISALMCFAAYSAPVQTPNTVNDQLVIPTTLEAHRSSVQSALTEARSSVETRLGVEVPPIRLYLSATPEQMRSLATEQQRALPPSWSAGLAFPRDRAVYIPVTGRAELAPLLRHELVHIALADAKIPLWVNEGLAVALGDGLSLERVWTLNEAAAAHRLHSLDELTRRFPEHGRPAQVAYAQAGHFINELAQEEGDAALRAWVTALISGATLREASAREFKSSLEHHESKWRARLERGPLAWIALTAKSETLWALTIIIFVWLGRRKLKQRKIRIYEIREAEPRGPRVITAPTPRVFTRPSPHVIQRAYPADVEDLESDLR